MCVSQCPDKFATYSEMQLQHKLNKGYWEYYKQFCKPGFNNPEKVLMLIYMTSIYHLDTHDELFKKASLQVMTCDCNLE